MRIQFVFNNDFGRTVDIDVSEVPDDEQTKAIEDDIYSAMEKYEEENGCFADFDYYECCFEVVQKHIHIAENRVVKTLYI